VKTLDLVKLGWSLIPCCTPEKRGCVQHGASCPSPGKRPLVPWKDYQRKPPSAQQIKRWAEKWPEANWAVLTGLVSGVVVLDLDAPPEELELGPMELTVTSLTGRGQHRFFQAPSRPPRSQTVSAAVEFKADGAYVVLPESLHPSGVRYEWLISPWEQDLAPIPEWLERKLQQKPRHLPEKRPLAEVVHGVRKGERNTQATRIAGKLLGALPPRDWEAVAWPLLVAWNQQNKPPLARKELRTVFEKIAERELRKALNDPRAPELQERIRRVLAENPNITERELRRKLSAYRYERVFDLIHYIVVRSQHPHTPTNGVCSTAKNGSLSRN